MAGNRIQSGSVTVGTLVRFAVVDPFRLAFGGKLCFQNGTPVIRFAGLELLVEDLPETAACFAGSMGRVKGEQSRVQLLERPAAAGAAHFRAHHGNAITCIE